MVIYLPNDLTHFLFPLKNGQHSSNSESRSLHETLMNASWKGVLQASLASGVHKAPIKRGSTKQLQGNLRLC